MIEKNQESALRFINNDFTSSLHAFLSSTVPLHVREMKQMVSDVYKIVNDIAAEYFKDLVNKKNHLTISGEKTRKSTCGEMYKV